MADKDDMLDYPGAANAAVFSLGKMKDSLAKIYRLLSSIQVLVCDVFHVFILVTFFFQGEGGGAGGCLPELRDLLLRVSMVFFFLSFCSFFFLRLTSCSWCWACSSR